MAAYGGYTTAIGGGDDDEELTYWEEKYGGAGDDEELTYWEEKYGGGTGSVDRSAYTSTYDDTDIGIALFQLIGGSLVIVSGTYALFHFHKSKWVLDIRTRSANLVLMGGTALLSTYVTGVNQSVRVLWGTDYGVDWFWISLILFFASPFIFGSYICRALRLAVVYHPRAKRALPWLVPERNYVAFLTVTAICFTAIPIYHEYTLEIWEIIPKQTSILATMALVFAGILGIIYPFIRNVDDLFNISTELVMVTVFLIFLSVGSKGVQKYGGPTVNKWIGGNIYFFMSLLVFWVSVVNPLRRLALDPLAATKHNRAERVLLSGRENFSTTYSQASAVSEREESGANKDEFRGNDVDKDKGNQGVLEPGRTDLDEGVGATAPTGGARVSAQPEIIAVGTPQPSRQEAGSWENRGSSVAGQGVPGTSGGGGSRGSGRIREAWDFERLARTPLLAAAFEDFARKALCHESVLFLAEVSRYQNEEYTDLVSGLELSQYESLSRITDVFIKPGSREEVNISGADRKRILEWAHKGQAWFDLEEAEERRAVFGQAYVEVRTMLEDNLLRRFLKTTEFKNVYAQRRILTDMMDSQP